LPEADGILGAAHLLELFDGASRAEDGHEQSEQERQLHHKALFSALRGVEWAREGSDVSGRSVG